MFQVFHLDNTKVDLGCFICCNDNIHMFQAYVQSVLVVSDAYFKCFHLYVACIAMVVHACFKCLFLCVSDVSDLCCKSDLDVAYVAIATHMFQEHVSNISYVLVVRCKCFKSRLLVTHVAMRARSWWTTTCHSRVELLRGRRRGSCAGAGWARQAWSYYRGAAVVHVWTRECGSKRWCAMLASTGHGMRAGRASGVGAEFRPNERHL
jgi:hypothetical protein